MSRWARVWESCCPWCDMGEGRVCFFWGGRGKSHVITLLGHVFFAPRPSLHHPTSFPSASTPTHIPFPSNTRTHAAQANPHLSCRPCRMIPLLPLIILHPNLFFFSFFFSCTLFFFPFFAATVHGFPSLVLFLSFFSFWWCLFPTPYFSFFLLYFSFHPLFFVPSSCLPSVPLTPLSSLVLRDLSPHSHLALSPSA